MAQLQVNIGNLSLRNPVMTASGTFGYGLEYADFVRLDRLGGIIVKGTTLRPREGNPYPRMYETAGGMLNCVGLQNKGVDYFCQEIYPQIKSRKIYDRIRSLHKMKYGFCEYYSGRGEDHSAYKTYGYRGMYRLAQILFLFGSEISGGQHIAAHGKTYEKV